jgi:hypothetical protein
MEEPDQGTEIWFERLGPTLGWFGSYSPISMKGFYALLAHTLPVLALWVLPVSLLAQFKRIPSAVALPVVAPVVVASLLLLMRTAHRHSLPRP